jgi:molybdopterin-guanine dinucleotide biosynthesis protein A
MNNTIAIILAGGSGKRFGMLKQFLPINGIPICGYTLKKFNKFSILFVVPEQHHLIAKNIVCSLKLKNVFIIVEAILDKKVYLKLLTI